MPYCSTLVVVVWSLAMSSQVTGLANALWLSARPPANIRASARGRGVLGRFLVVMVVLPIGGGRSLQ